MSKRVKANNDVVMYRSVNFAYEDKGNLSMEILDAPDTYIDERNYMVSTRTDFSNMQWLKNYMQTAAYFFNVNRDSYPAYLCNLGYIPVVYLPTCVPDLGVKLMLRLDELNIPYIKVKGTSFVKKYFDTDIVDAWVHKLDAAKVLNCAPEDVRSDMFLKEVFGIV